jgi:hypothetical protein
MSIAFGYSSQNKSDPQYPFMGNLLRPGHLIGIELVGNFLLANEQCTTFCLTIVGESSTGEAILKPKLNGLVVNLRIVMVNMVEEALSGFPNVREVGNPTFLMHTFFPNVNYGIDFHRYSAKETQGSLVLAMNSPFPFNILYHSKIFL